MQEDAVPTTHEQQLFKRFCQNDVRAEREVFNTYGNRLFQFIRRSCIYEDRDSAEDCLQNTWIKLLKHCGKPLESGLWTMLCTMARTQAIDDWRMEQRKKRGADQQISSTTTAEGGEWDLADSDADPEIWLFEEYKQAAFQQAFNRLPEKQQQALHLQWGEGLAIKDIAQRMQEKHETVRSHLRYARDKLKSALIKQGINDGDG